MNEFSNSEKENEVIENIRIRNKYTGNVTITRLARYQDMNGTPIQEYTI